MLFIGSKVKVIMSAVKGKGARIRTGSIGYVAAISKLHYVPSYTNGMYVAYATIVFTRFGYEYRHRNELKHVLLVYPSVGTHKVKNKIKYLKYIVEHASNYTRKINVLFKKEHIIVNKAVPMAVCSINSSTNLSEDKNELVAWLKSIIFSKQLQNILFTSKETPANKTLSILTNDSKSKRMAIFNLIKGSKNIKAYVTKLYNGDLNNLHDFICKVQILLLLHKLKTLAHFNNKITKHLISNKNILSAYWLSVNNGISTNQKHEELHKQYGTYLSMIKEWSDVYILLSIKR